jgi:hypothetical protein
VDRTRRAGDGLGAEASFAYAPHPPGAPPGHSVQRRSPAAVPLKNLRAFAGSSPLTRYAAAETHLPHELQADASSEFLSTRTHGLLWLAATRSADHGEAWKGFRSIPEHTCA